MLTNIEQLDINQRYTYEDYLTWQFDQMVELIKGKLFKMTPAPGSRHQQVSSRLLQPLLNHFQDSKCQVFHAPFDVRLTLPKQQSELNTVVQPDICVVCDLEKIDDQGCLGAPDWIIEILSPSSSHKDLHDKFEIYELNGVQEYWIVHPHEGTVLTYFLDENGKYQLPRNKPFTSGEKMASHIFPNLEIEAAPLFDHKLF